MGQVLLLLRAGDKNSIDQAGMRLRSLKKSAETYDEVQRHYQTLKAVHVALTGKKDQACSILRSLASAHPDWEFPARALRILDPNPSASDVLRGLPRIPVDAKKE